MIWPKILVMGFADSGTSFLCNLIVRLGFSPGDPKDLKPADSHNRWGYWEHMPIQRASRSHIGEFRLLPPSGLPYGPFNLERQQDIERIAREGYVEVYKDGIIPYIHGLFHPQASCVVIERPFDEIASSSGLAHLGYSFTEDELRSSLEKYRECVRQMAQSRPKILTVRYDRFRSSFADELARLCQFLGVETHDVDALHELFRPRRR